MMAVNIAFQTYFSKKLFFLLGISICWGDTRGLHAWFYFNLTKPRGIWYYCHHHLSEGGEARKTWPQEHSSQGSEQEASPGLFASKVCPLRAGDHLLQATCSLFSDLPAFSPRPHVKCLSIISQLSENSLLYTTVPNSLPRRSSRGPYGRTSLRAYRLLCISAHYVLPRFCTELTAPSQEALCSVCFVSRRAGCEWRERWINGPEGRGEGNKNQQNFGPKKSHTSHMRLL